MKKNCLLSTLVLLVLAVNVGFAQDFSNKGKDFWVAYGYHQVMAPGGGAQQMVLYFSAEQDANVVVSIPGNGYIANYHVNAGTTIASNPIPKAGAQDARLTQASVMPEDKGIHITSDRPIVAYAHIYNSSVSGATILYPTATLGKEYYSVNYKNISNTGNANCWFYVIAADPGNTTVEITPKADAINHPAGTPFTVTLAQGQVYNVMGTVTGNNGVDLTGSTIRSISTPGEGCKRIAVFSGSGRIAISCNNTAPSSDNYMVQSVPKTAWGKKYLTVPTMDYAVSGGGTFSASARNFYRICVTDPFTIVRINGVPTSLPLQNNFFYEIDATTTPQLIEADIPIMVAQYTPSQGGSGCGTVGGDGDPEVIYLSPVEQSINKVLWNACSQFSINLNKHYINVVIPNGGTAISSFRLDGVPIPASVFTPHPSDPAYSYARINVSSTAGSPSTGTGLPHIVQSDSGFNAIAYGYGGAESYGYNAGTNIKDIYQYVTVQNQYATVNFPAACKGSPFYFSMTFPYQPTQIKWLFSGLFSDITVLNPVPDGTTVVNGKTLYIYRLPLPYTINTAGTYPIKVIAQNPTPDGCGGEQEIDYDLQVFDPPVASFDISSTGCVTDPIGFVDNSNTAGRPMIAWHWNFGDNTTDNSGPNVTHTYAAGATYTIKHAIITDVGCLSDTVTKTVTLTNKPVASFTVAAPQFCANKPVTFTNTSTLTGPGAITKWTWDFGDGPPTVITAPSSPDIVHTYTAPGTYDVKLIAETGAGCPSTPVTVRVTIGNTPSANFNLPAVCQPNGLAQFTDLSTITGGTITGWNWDFGDLTSSTLQNPSHNYTGPSPFTVTLTVTTNSGCTDTKTQVLNTVYAEPQAAFAFPAEVCVGSPANFTDQSTAPSNSVAQWNWDFGVTGGTSTAQNPSYTYTTPGTYTVTLNVTSAAGCPTVGQAATHQVVVNPLPTASFTSSAQACANSSVTLTSTSVANAGAITQYNWTVNGTPTGGNNPVVNFTPTTPGNYTVVLTIQTDKGCSNSVTNTVTVHPKPVANFNLPSVCLPNGTANFISSSTVSSGSITGYAWDFGDGVGTSTLQNPTYNYTGSGPFTVQLSVTTDQGCTDVKSQSITTIYPEPLAAFTLPAEVCLGTPVNFTDGSSAPSSSVAGWNWDFGVAGGTSTSQNPSYTYTAPGTYTVTLNVTSAAGCATVGQFAQHTVTVNPLPTSDFTISLPGCVTRDITFTDASVANAGNIVKWTWNYGEGSPVVQTTPGALTHAYNTVGTYNATLQVETNKGCISTVTTKPVTIHVLPNAEFVVPEACISDVAAMFTDQSTVAPGTVTAWQWNFGDANATPGNPNISTAQNGTHHFTATGNYNIQLVAFSNEGCTDTTTHSMFVNGSVPLANFAVQNPTALCSNNIVRITDASTVDVGNLTKIDIFWDNSIPGPPQTDDDPTAGEVYSHTYPEFGTPATKTVTIRYRAYSGATCVNEFTRTITLLATPTLAFANVPEVCEDAPAFQVTQAQMTNGLPGTGVFTGAGITGAGLFTPSTAGVGAHNITYTYTGTNGCVNSISKTVTVNPKPGVDAGPDKVVLEGGSVMLTPSVNIGSPVTYLWTPSTGLSNPTISNPLASPISDMTYTVTVTTDKGCKASDAVFVKLLLKPLIPNIFSPNGDGVHDRWVIPFLDTYPGCTVEIYNAYGQLVYRSIGYPTPWDGKVKGKDVPVGTYYYIVDPKNGRPRMSGYVDVVR
jgi:gliding motility-associated-like protein